MHSEPRGRSKLIELEEGVAARWSADCSLTPGPFSYYVTHKQIWRPRGISPVAFSGTESKTC